jgi:hypothetical protein
MAYGFFPCKFEILQKWISGHETNAFFNYVLYGESKKYDVEHRNFCKIAPIDHDFHVPRLRKFSPIPQ